MSIFFQLKMVFQAIQKHQKTVLPSFLRRIISKRNVKITLEVVFWKVLTSPQI